jgi:hypothetical protein
MKGVICLLIMAALCSCKKDNDIKNIKQDIAGSWELRKSSSFAGIQNYPAGNGSIFVFDQNNNYQRKAHDTLIISGHYSIRKQKDCYERETNYACYLSEVSSGGYQYIEIKNDTLIFSTSNCISDGTISYYQRL